MEVFVEKPSERKRAVRENNPQLCAAPSICEEGAEGAEVCVGRVSAWTRVLFSALCEEELNSFTFYNQKV